ncbi:MAG: HAMP domain-containing histidine kinase [Succinivibrionaceae bacterium]|nr:HAMP domain-containing histidine kinase [Succinivibrionaceae bacterium]
MEGPKAVLARSLRLRLAIIFLVVGGAVIALMTMASLSSLRRDTMTFIDDELSQVAGVIISYDMLIPQRWGGMPRHRLHSEDGAPRARMAQPPRPMGEQGFFPVPSLSDLFTGDRDIIIAPLVPPPGGTSYLDPRVGDGFYSLLIDNQRARALVATNRFGKRFVVAMSLSLLDEAGAAFVRTAALEFLAMLAAYVLVVAMGVRLLFRPVDQMASALRQRNEQDLSPLEGRIPSELDSFVMSINQLFGRIKDGILREKRFIADAAHELRTPLTAIALEAEGLCGEDLGPRARERLAVLREGIRREQELTNNLLTLARGSAPSGQERPAARVPVRDLMVEVIEELGPIADQKGIDLGIDGEPDFTLTVPRQDLKSILGNFCSNALKYAPEGGRCDLTAWQEGETLAIAVRDDGPGIPEADLPHVLEPFYRVGGDTAATPGTGLGLAIAAQAAHRLGGRIRMRNLSPSGLEAALLLPAAALGGDAP